MKAAVLNSIPSTLDIEDIEIDGPGPREVLVRTAAVGVCHSDLHFMEGKYRTPTPAVLGHEAAGVVEAVGADVVGIAPGDHVISCLSVFCGHCEFCLSGRPHLCMKADTRRPAGAPPRLRRGNEPVNQTFDLSAFAEHMLVHEHALVKVRPDIPLDRAALVGCGVVTGLGSVFRTARVEPGQTVAVIGAGGIGLNCIQGARIAGAGRIIAVDALASKLELARTFGATDVVDASGGDAVAQVVELTGGGVDHAFEAIGLKVTCEQAFGMIRRGGTATIIGMVPVGVNLEIPGAAFLGEKKLQGSLMGSNQFRTDMPRYIDMYLDGRLELDRLVSARRPLEEINQAYDDLKTGEVARSVIVFDD